MHDHDRELADRAERIMDNLTTNMQQPIRRFSAGDTPALPDTPINATTGCTTLPSDPHTASTTSEAYQQSANTGPYPDNLFESIQPISEKDPPAPSPDVYIKDFNTPQERVVPITENNYSGPKLHIVLDPADGCFVEIEDDRGNSIDVGKHTTLLTGYRSIEVPDWRHLLRQILELQETNRDLVKERHALATALQVANETMRTSIDKIMSLIRVIK